MGMRERRGDLWALAHELNADAVAITTNGFIKANGLAVLGRGCALEATKRWPDLPGFYGAVLKLHELATRRLTHEHFGNIYLANNTPMPYHLVAFPVKPRHVIANNMSTNIVKHQRWNFGTGSKVPGWAAVADLGLIEKSSKELIQLIQMNQWERVLLPRPGCGAGELQYNEVKEVIAPILDDHVIVVSK
jgi:hypothetical protein